MFLSRKDSKYLDSISSRNSQHTHGIIHCLEAKPILSLLYRTWSWSIRSICSCKNQELLQSFQVIWGFLQVFYTRTTKRFTDLALTPQWCISDFTERMNQVLDGTVCRAVAADAGAPLLFWCCAAFSICHYELLSKDVTQSEISPCCTFWCFCPDGKFTVCSVWCLLISKCCNHKLLFFPFLSWGCVSDCWGTCYFLDEALMHTTVF